MCVVKIYEILVVNRKQFLSNSSQLRYILRTEKRTVNKRFLLENRKTLIIFRLYNVTHFTFYFNEKLNFIISLSKLKFSSETL